VVRYFWGERLLQSTLHRDPTEVKIGATARCEFDPADGLAEPQFTLLSPSGDGLSLNVPPGAHAELTREAKTVTLPAGSHPLLPLDRVCIQIGRTRSEISFLPAPPRVGLGHRVGFVYTAALLLATLGAGLFVAKAQFASAEPSALSEDEARDVADFLRADDAQRPSVLNLVHQNLAERHSSAEGALGTSAKVHRSAPKAAGPRAKSAVCRLAMLKVLGPRSGSSGSLGSLLGPTGGLGGLSTSFGSSAVATQGLSGSLRSHSFALPAAQVTGEDLSTAGTSPFVATASKRLSTFSVDVDTASYSIARRFLLDSRLPPPESVRPEEFLNAFSYAYPSPDDGPFAVYFDGAPSPYGQGKHLLRIGVQARRVEGRERKPAHLTFLVDVSGSMDSLDKLSLAQQALEMLVGHLQHGDTVALVTFSDHPREVLPATGVEQANRIRSAIRGLRIEGSTGLYQGLKTAYAVAAKSLAPKAISRVILLSDGDANVGPTDHSQMLEAIRGHVLEGVTLTTVGFGMGNYQDRVMEQLADKGNGNYVYVNDLDDAHRAFVQQLGGTLEVVAKDVKIQVAFNPESIVRYRLIGYENRRLAAQDFANDRVDAGEIGAGHSVTALYEVELAPGRGEQSLATVAVRAKAPNGERSTESDFVFRPGMLWQRFEGAPTDLRWAAGVAGAAELMRQNPLVSHYIYRTASRVACGATSQVPDREEFCGLLRGLAAAEQELTFGGVRFDRSGARLAAFQSPGHARD
jgi:Ca-activated chloride channel family protein